ncbi:relaxase domain-containing protein (plasmid) [Acinetobacter seifertii]|uniref:MobF family relaxase n=1 Tax=Acinetobacter seifertii TaxID=1530123 RepID=UPI00168A895E|nr:MobF family relaxase [Acinetobacter seifertii]QNX28721.1 relaxase domain-containing protein [Acinetobacter seifertii]
MMSMTTLKSASQASTYYSKDNYYTKEETAESLANAGWYGKGATVLGLDGENFDPEKFKALLEGEIDDDKKIGRTIYDENGIASTQHRPGVDLTFSAPKSVSILSEVFKNDDVRQAHEDAVKSTLDLVEKKYAQTRVSIDGSMQREDTENLIIALFSHNNSRELDPQTHTHAVVMNATLNSKGEWTALTNEEIYQNQKLVGAIYNSELASNLKDLGLDLEFKPNGNFEISGISQDVIDEFSQRRMAMIESAEAKGIDLSTASASMREVIALDTRKTKKNVTQESLDNDWKERADSYGLTKEYVESLFSKDNVRVKEKSDPDSKQPESGTQQPEHGAEQPEHGNKQPESGTQQPEHGNKQPESGTQQPEHGDKQPGNGKGESAPGNNQPDNGKQQPERNKSKTIEQDAEDTTETKSWLDRLWNFLKRDQPEKKPNTTNKDKSQTAKPIKEWDGLSEKEQALREAVFYSVGHHTEREMMIKRGDIEATALDKAEGQFTYKDVENEVNRLIKSNILVATKTGKITTQRLAHSEIWSIDHVREERKSVDKILDSEVIKSEIAEREALQKFKYTDGQKDAIESIFTTDSRYHSVNGLAGTGKTTMLTALNKIGEKQGFIVKGMAGSGTAAKNLELETGIPSSTNAMFQLNESKLQNDLAKTNGAVSRKNEIWVVDESSITGQENFAEIMKLAKSADARIVFLGDKLQLQAIDAGKPFEILQKEMSFSSMENINRQKTQELKDVVAVITAKNSKGEIALSENAKAFDLLDQQGRVMQINQEDLHHKLIDEYMSHDQSKRDNSLIITPFNSDRKILNEMVREERIKNGELTGDELTFSTYSNKNLTKAQQSEVVEYKPGDVVRFNKTYNPEGKTFKKDEYYTVVDTYKITKGKREQGLKLKDKDGVIQDWNSKNKNLIEVYEKEEKKLLKGDLIKINRTNGNFKNGEKYTFKGIEGNQVLLTNEKNEEHRMDLSEFKHWDHGYATTIYSSQGLTKENVFMLINSSTLSSAQNDEKAAKNLGKIFGNRAFYVGVTRASKELKIYTHDKNVARMAVGYSQDKTSFAQETQYGKDENQFENNKGFDMEH